MRNDQESQSPKNHAIESCPLHSEIHNPQSAILLESGRILLGVLGALLLLNTLLVYLQLAICATIPRDLMYPEGAIVWGAWKVAHGLSVYEDWRQWPHHFTPYGPALYYPVGWLLRLFHPSPINMDYYILGRAQSVIALAGVGLLAVLLARRARCSRWVAWTGGLGMLGLLPGILSYTATYRPDAPMVFWNMLAVWLALGGMGRRWRRWAVVGCLWLAAAYKPAGWAAPLVVAWLAWGELGRKSTIRWGLIYLGGGLAGVGLMDLLTGGRFSLNAIVANLCGFGVPPFVGRISESDPFLYADLLVRFLVPALFGVWLFRHGDLARPWRALGLYFFLSTLFSAAQLARVGADVNFLLEPYVLGAVAAAMAYTRWFSPAAPPDQRARGWIRIPALTLIGLSLALTLRDNVPSLPACLKLRHERFMEHELTREAPPVLLMDSAFMHPDPAAHALMDPVFYAIMVKRGKLSAQPLLERLEGRRFRLVVLSPIARTALREQSGDPSIIQALERNYQLRPQAGLLEIWQARWQ